MPNTDLHFFHFFADYKWNDTYTFEITAFDNFKTDAYQ